MDSTIIEKSLEEFDTVTFNSSFEVFLIQGSENSIKIEGAERIIDEIDFTITNNILTIKNSFKHGWLHPSKNKVKVYLTVNQISRINANETCNIKSVNTLVGTEIGLVFTGKLNEAALDLNCNTFYYWNNFPCSGKVTLSGNTNELKIWNVALMAIDAQNLVSNYVLVDNASKGDCKFTCIQTLDYSISGEGNIYVSGNPSTIIKTAESSTGKLNLQ
jgi:hypothetical protein